MYFEYNKKIYPSKYSLKRFVCLFVFSFHKANKFACNCYTKIPVVFSKLAVTCKHFLFCCRASPVLEIEA